MLELLTTIAVWCSHYQGDFYKECRSRIYKCYTELKEPKRTEYQNKKGFLDDDKFVIVWDKFRKAQEDCFLTYGGKIK